MLAQKDAVYLHGQGFGHATCHVCFLPQEFHRGVFSKHESEDGVCEGGGQTIAVLRVAKIRKTEATTGKKRC